MRLFELNNHSKLILSILLACPFVIAADTADQVAKQIDRDINLVRLTEKQKEDKANKIVVKAKDFFVNGQYKQAIDNYLSAIEIFKKIGIGETSAFDKQIKYCQEQIYQCYYYWAMDIVAKVEKKSFGKNYAEAIKLCRKAAEIYPPCKAKMDAKIKRFSVLRDAAARRHADSESKLIPSKKDDNYDIEVLMKQADVLIKAGRYQLAKDKYEQILLNDIYNYKAIEGLRAVNKMIEKLVHVDFMLRTRNV